mgnify:CR=1 FL=1
MSLSKYFIKFLLCLLIMKIVSGCTDANCQTCANPDICDACTPPFILDKVLNVCEKCSEAIANCTKCNGIEMPAVTCSACASGFAVNSTDNTCVACKTLTGCTSCVLSGLNTQVICLSCSSSYVLSGGSCIGCTNALSNCNVCNDTVFPLSCVSCLNGFYSSDDNLRCDTCKNLI